MDPSPVLNPIIQFGFAGMCAILLVMLAWLIKRLLDLQTTTNAVVAENTTAIQTLIAQSAREENSLEALNRKLLSRPCLRE